MFVPSICIDFSKYRFSNIVRVPEYSQKTFPSLSTPQFHYNCLNNLETEAAIFNIRFLQCCKAMAIIKLDSINNIFFILVHMLQQERWQISWWKTSNMNCVRDKIKLFRIVQICMQAGIIGYEITTRNLHYIPCSLAPLSFSSKRIKIYLHWIHNAKLMTNELVQNDKIGGRRGVNLEWRKFVDKMYVELPSR